MSKYNTKQRKLLLDFLTDNTDSRFSAKQIAAALAEQNISLSAVYRNLSELEGEGKVSRFSKSGDRETYYQYTASECCKDRLHLSCKSCGKTFHMDFTGAQQLVKSVATSDGFDIDKSRTVLYGICKNCKCCQKE